MFELEIKAQVDPKKIEKKLHQWGCEMMSEGFQKDVYYSHPSKDFAVTDEALRIRCADNKVKLCYKGARFDKKTKSREELTSMVDDNIFEILEKVGFTPDAQVHKHRRVFELDGVKVTLDSVHELGEFLELELITEVPKKSATKQLFEVLKKLGVPESKTTRKSYLELIAEKSKKTKSAKKKSAKPRTSKAGRAK